ncbi:MAG: helix-turn-helix transcriptional regulator [Chloroflexi bacterium]|nr:helix-turn-helix transcriptional regulator [Chloroflexota bacterium]
MNESTTFGKMVKERRQQLEITKEDLANRANCATISVRRIEAGSLRPSIQLAEQLAEALNVPVAEQEAFIKLARNVSSGNGAGKRKIQEQIPAGEPGIDSRMWQYTEYFLPLLPLIFMALVLVINPRYLGTLAAVKPPFIIVNILPWGWLVIVLALGLMLVSKVVLQVGRRGRGKHQVYYRIGLNGFVLLFMTFPAILLILLAPALFQLLQSSVLDSR